MKKTPAKYYNIMTSEGSTEATIFIYGYIGEEYSYDPQEGWKQSGTTDVDFVKEIAALAEKYSVIHIRINSYGGEVFHGAAIVNAIRKCAAEVHTWNDGVAASMAAGVFLAGHKRHMAKNALLMLHSALNICWGNAKDMRECADVLDKINDSLLAGIAEGTGIAEDTLRAAYFADYADHWLTYADAIAAGFVAEEASPYTADNVPANLAKMTYQQLVAHFHKHDHTDAPGLLAKIRAAFKDTLAAVTGGNKPHSHSQNDIDMKIEDFKTSIGDGTLPLDDVKAFLATLQADATPATPATPEPEPEENAEVTELKSTVTSLSDQLAQMKATLEQWGKAPGAGKATPSMPAGDPVAADGGNTPEAILAKANAAFAAAAAKNEPAQFITGK